MSEATTITHLAGPLIRYVDHQRQRCSWCGYVLVNDDLTRMAMQVDPCKACGAQYGGEMRQGDCQRSVDGLHDFEMPKPPGGWPFEAFVEVTTNGGFRAANVVWSIIEVEPLEDESVKVPENACMRVPAELTPEGCGVTTLPVTVSPFIRCPGCDRLLDPATRPLDAYHARVCSALSDREREFRSVPTANGDSRRPSSVVATRTSVPDSGRARGPGDRGEAS